MPPVAKKRKGADGSAIRCPPVEEDTRTSPAKCQVLTPPSSSNSDDSEAPPPRRTRRAPPSPAKCQVLTPRSSTSSSDDSDAPPVPGPRRIRRAPPSLDDFTIMRRIGQGNYGKVHLVHAKRLKRCYVLKVMQKSTVVRAPYGIEQANNEAQMMRLTMHPFIVTLYTAFQDSRNLYFMMELAQGGDLHGLMSTHPKRQLPTVNARFYASELVLAIGYLHSLGIIFRDVKPENILLAADGHIKLADFGYAIRARRAYAMCGTPDYMAPEVFTGETDGYTEAVDWYALGVLIFEMLAGHAPFTIEDVFEDIPRFTMRGLEVLEAWPESIGFVEFDLISQLMHLDVEFRLGCGGRGKKEVMEHGWFARVEWKKLVMREVEPPVIPDLESMEDVSAFQTFKDDDGIRPGCAGGNDPYKDSFPEFDWPRR